MRVKCGECRVELFLRSFYFAKKAEGVFLYHSPLFIINYSILRYFFQNASVFNVLEAS